MNLSACSEFIEDEDVASSPKFSRHQCPRLLVHFLVSSKAFCREMSFPAIRYVASSAKSALGRVLFNCHVKPGASKQREGIISVSDTVIEICVSARAREGEANKAVKEIFSNVSLLVFSRQSHQVAKMSFRL